MTPSLKQFKMYSSVLRITAVTSLQLKFREAEFSGSHHLNQQVLKNRNSVTFLFLYEIIDVKNLKL